MDRDWVRLGKAFRTDRERQSLRQKDAAAALGVGLTSIQDIERGHEYTKPTLTIRAYANLLGWVPESVDTVLAGGNISHTAAEAPPASSASESLADADIGGQRLPLRIVHELSDEGELLDTAVIKIGDKGRAVIVVKGEPGVSAEELLEELRVWSRTRKQLESPADTEPSAVADGS